MKPFQTAVFKLCQLCTLLLLVHAAKAQQVTADFSADLRSGCSPMVVNFKDLSTGNPTSWRWNLGNGTLSSLQNPTATYFNPGAYTIKLVARNASGVDSVVRTQYIVVNANPEANFGASDSTGCFPLPVQFTDSSVAGSGTLTNWQWDFGDGTLSSLKNPKHTYTGPGNFTVTLRVTNSNGCVKLFTRPAFIRLQTGVQAAFSHSTTSGCSTPAAVTFNNTSIGTGSVNYKWLFGDGSTSTLQHPNHLYQKAGTYTVTLIVTNSTGCADTLVKTNAINIGVVQANFTKPDTICAGQTFVLTNTSNPTTVSSKWDFGDGTTSTSINPSKDYRTGGTYQITLINDFGGCKDTVTKTIVIIAKPVPAFTAVNNNSCGTPLIVSFTNKSVGGSKYIWDFGDGVTSNDVNPVHTYTRAGTFTVTLTATSSQNCSESTVKFNFVKIVPPSIKKLGDFPAKACLPYTLSVQPVIETNEPVTSYFWDFGDGFTSTLATPNHTYTTAGDFTVKLRITTAPGCVDSLVQVKAVQVGHKPLTAFSAVPRDVCAQVAVVFKDETTGPQVHSWLWSFGDGGTSALKNPVHNYADTGKFDVQLITSNFGCMDTVKKVEYIRVRPPVAVFETQFDCTDRLTRTFKNKSIGATTWFWDFGDGSTSTVPSPTHTYAKAGAYFVTLKVTNATCEHSSTQTVTLINEKGNLSISDAVVCRNGQLTFNVANINTSNIASYNWYFEGLGNAMRTTNQTPVTHSYTTSGTKQVAVIITDLLGCKDTLYSSAPVSVYGPTAGFQTFIPGTCVNTGVTFTDTSSSDGLHPISQWTWNYGDTTVRNNGGTFLHSFRNPGTFSISLVVTDSRGCRDSIFKSNVLNITRPLASFTIRDSMLCPATTLDITNKSWGMNLKQVWSFGDGNVVTTNQPLHSYAADGNYTIGLRVTDIYGCTDSMSSKVSVFKANAAFAMSDSFSTCPPLLVNFSSTTNNFTNHGYDFGDGGVSTLLSPSHLYTYPGTYYVKRWAINNGGCTDTVIQKIVIQGPRGKISYNPLVSCNPAKVDFTATTENCVNYVWDYDDGTTVFSTKTAMSHVYGSTGMYIPKIILEDASGCKVPVTGTDTIRVMGVETFVTSNNRLLCDSGLVSFTDSTISNDLITSYKWDFGDGTTSTKQSAVHNYKATGWYPVTLTTTTQTGCVATATEQKYIKVVSSPDIRITGNTSACEPAAFPFQGTVVKKDTASLSWSWSFDNGQTSTLANPAAQYYSAAGNYNVRAIATNMDGCSDTSLLAITVQPKPVVDAGADTEICRGQTLQLNPTGADTYLWAPHLTLNCNNCNTPTARPLSAITYRVTGKTIFGCTSEDSITVQVKQPFKMTVGRGDTLCDNQSFKLSASGASSYQWTPALYLNNPTAATPTTTPKSSVRYQVIGTDDKNCFTDTGYVDMKVYSMPKVEINGDSVLTLNVGSTLKLGTTASSDITKWKWSPSLGLDCITCASPTTSVTQNVTYTVIAANDGNCIARDQVTVQVLCNNANIFMPNTFSPNGDGANDVFYPRGKGVFSIKSFRVFNRWGQVVFERGATNANDASQGWDGTFNGVKQNADVFLFIADVICENGAIFPIKGNVTLLR
ncbi:PKD domain-containing protein [Segetibacter sp. 3557_3]|uniref:PKD domain-containing protein n=1 Tax=Segetibacter sp. 3557_3 TaxID=2547429 RepID=UPI00105845E9|nr:PKD domain-containing protein [Segetibacter sp. 3557_3]TDH25496.1 PKD domain-containing protein [Segetibacter sp. 3557_3]